MTPPLPPGVEGDPVAPNIHTGCPEPDRDDAYIADLIDERNSAQSYYNEAAGKLSVAQTTCNELADQVERLKADRRALDTAVTGLRELESQFAGAAEIDGDWYDARGERTVNAYGECRASVSALLDRIGGTR